MDLQIEDIGVLGTNSTKLSRSLPLVNSSAESTREVLINKFDFGSVPEFGVADAIKTGEADLKSEQWANSKILLDYQRLDQGVVSPIKKNDAVISS